MNIKFKSIDIQNFRSIDRAKVTLENQGTVIVKGINEYENNASSNGSGKSSIFEAIIYAIYEETSSGEKDVENRIIGNGFGVTLDFDVDNIPYTISRQGKNGKSTVCLLKNNIDISARNKTDTNKLIQNLLGINKSVFLDSIFLSQNAVTNLASLAPASRKERLEILTNTDSTISVFKESLKQQQAKYEADCIEHQQKISEYTGNKQAINSQIYTLQQKISEAELELERKKSLGTVEDIDKNIQDKTNEISEYEKNIEYINNYISENDKILQTIKEEQVKCESEKSEQDALRTDKKEEWNAIDKTISQYVSTKNFHSTNITKIDIEIEKIKNSDKCPTCGRKYDNANEEHIKQTIENLLSDKTVEDASIMELDQKIAEAQTNLSKVEEEGKAIKEAIEQIDTKLNTIKDNYNQVEISIKNKQTEKDTAYANIHRLQNEIQELQSRKEEILKVETNNIKEYKEMIDKLNQDVINIDNNITSEQNEYNKSNDYVSTVKHSLQLVTKEFRTYLLQNSLKYLNKVLENYSSKLFSNSGDIIKIQETDTKLDINLGQATYESLSGGEKTRVNIALLLAQKSLASMIGNISCNMIILDEVLGYCDSEAESVVTDLITDELDSLESIFMVSHKEIPIGYDTELVVIKDKNGLSRIKNY